jgi:hypothetical protein
LQVLVKNTRPKKCCKVFLFDATSMFTDHGLLSVGKQLQTVFGSPDSVKYLNLTMKKITSEKAVRTFGKICLVDDECDSHNGGLIFVECILLRYL